MGCDIKMKERERENRDEKKLKDLLRIKFMSS